MMEQIQVSFYKEIVEYSPSDPDLIIILCHSRNRYRMVDWFPVNFAE